MQQKTSLNLAEDRREIIVRGTPGFPCGAYFTDFSLFPARMISWHWHEGIEFSMVVGGAARLYCVDGEYTLGAGDGMFINDGALHALDILGGEGCRMISLILDQDMLAGSEDSVFSRRYVQPLIRSHAVGILHLSPAIDWQKDILQHLREAFLIYDKGEYGFELLVRARLTECIWSIVRNSRTLIHSAPAPSPQAETRVKTMLDFIHMHYAEPILLSDIAAAASISERECLRAFQKMLGKTPNACLLRYRSLMAARRLQESDQPIADICFDVGFNSQSHFGQIFKRYFHVTPREYRTQYHKTDTKIL